MHIEFLVEEPSAEVALVNILPKIVGAGVSFRIHVFQDFKAGYRKVSAAKEISRHMIPERNRSRSFQVFRQGLLALLV